MRASDLLADLRRRGIAVAVERDELVLRTTKGALTPEIKTAVTAGKRELLELVLEGGGFDAAGHVELAWGEARADQLLQDEIDDLARQAPVERMAGSSVRADGRRGRALGLAREAGCPFVPLGPGRRVVVGEAARSKFVSHPHTPDEDLDAAAAALALTVAEEMPEAEAVIDEAALRVFWDQAGEAAP